MRRIDPPGEDDSLVTPLTLVLIVALCAGLTHIGSVLLLPALATRDAVSLLDARDAANRMAVLAPNRPGTSLIPFGDPATVQGVCPYDLTKAPLRVKARTEDGRLLTLSFRTTTGRIFYSMTDRAALHDTIDIRLVTAEQLKTIEASDNEDDDLPTELRLKAPSAKGLMLATALVARPGEARDAEARIKAVSCASEPIAPSAQSPKATADDQ